MRAACPVATFARQGLHCSGARPAACRSWLIKPHWPVPTATRGGAGIGAGFGRTVPRTAGAAMAWGRSEEHTSELQSRLHLVCRLLLEKKKYIHHSHYSYIHTITHLDQFNNPDTWLTYLLTPIPHPQPSTSEPTFA